MTGRRITDNLDVMLSVLPPFLAQKLVENNRSDDLLEVILDLGRMPTARYLDNELVLRNYEGKVFRSRNPNLREDSKEVTALPVSSVLESLLENTGAIRVPVPVRSKRRN